MESRTAKILGSMIILTLAAALPTLWAFYAQAENREKTGQKPTLAVLWTDADSGYIHGKNTEIPFRLHDIDAPETRKGRYKCELELERGLDAKAVAVGLTTGAKINITAAYGFDRYDRLVIDMSANRRDVAEYLLKFERAKPWDYDGGDPKPEWCSP
jgi:endonuclease YncB( thermonuclease family)